MHLLRLIVGVPSRVAAIGVCAATLLVGGCASTHPVETAAADRLPPQVSPAADIRQGPNYGETSAPLPLHPLSPADEEAVIAAAITAHEIRRP